MMPASTGTPCFSNRSRAWYSKRSTRHPINVLWAEWGRGFASASLALSRAGPSTLSARRTAKIRLSCRFRRSLAFLAGALRTRGPWWSGGHHGPCAPAPTRPAAADRIDGVEARLAARRRARRERRHRLDLGAHGRRRGRRHVGRGHPHRRCRGARRRRVLDGGRRVRVGLVAARQRARAPSAAELRQPRPATPRAGRPARAHVRAARPLARDGRTSSPSSSPATDPLRAHLDVEYKLDPEDLNNPWAAASSSAVAFTLGSLVPLLAALLSPASWMPWSIVVATVVALLVTGVVFGADRRLRQAARHAARAHRRRDRARRHLVDRHALRHPGPLGPAGGAVARSASGTFDAVAGPDDDEHAAGRDPLERRDDGRPAAPARLGVGIRARPPRDGGADRRLDRPRERGGAAAGDEHDAIDRAVATARRAGRAIRAARRRSGTPATRAVATSSPNGARMRSTSPSPASSSATSKIRYPTTSRATSATTALTPNTATR